MTRPELADLDDAGRMMAFLACQAGTSSPLPTDLLEVLETFDDLDHFAALRRDQERDGLAP